MIIRTAVSSNDPDLESVTRVILASGAIDACIETCQKMKFLEELMH